ncbi:hypothetical protein H6G76_05775 [Nostoc sp. FACHB-152]|uniref:hypothetical protein n=1 Tax=unclassified Nostoc TaxID=2593658 RepID=UPI001686ADFD|nr:MULTISPECIES: hypothetical protein [unclassified Nostoc]MBD2446682.1 hypothetical protein [Nostoc sp. FACHB-152]MBD2466530.1 hypothetical protein [Nostoc sp. FACHB-145]
MRDKIPVQVLGCLRPGIITVIAFPGNGFVDGGLLMEVPTEIIPVELRMPNSEFIVVCDQRRYFIQVLPKDSDNI